MSFVSLKLKTVRGYQGDISELLVPPDLLQIRSSLFLEIFRRQKDVDVNHLQLNCGTQARPVGICYFESTM